VQQLEFRRIVSLARGCLTVRQLCSVVGNYRAISWCLIINATGPWNGKNVYSEWGIRWLASKSARLHRPLFI